MKKSTIFILSGFLLAFFACTKDAPVVKIAPAAVQPAQDRGLLPDSLSVRLQELGGHTSAYTWKDLDQFYRKVIAPISPDESYRDNARKMCMFFMVKKYQLTENADPATLAYYTTEMQSLPYIHPETMLALLKSMKGYWPDDKIRQIARAEYEEGLAYIKNELLDPETALKTNRPRYEGLLELAGQKN